MVFDKHIITRIKEGPEYMVGEVCRVYNFNILGIKFNRVKVLKEIVCPIEFESDEVKKQCRDFIQFEMDGVARYYIERGK